jgi:hypothetical protein
VPRSKRLAPYAGRGQEDARVFWRS